MTAPVAPKPTPKPWPEYAEPTVAQLADFMRRCTTAERVRIAELALAHGKAASACFEQNHVNELAHLRRLVRELRGDVEQLRAAGTNPYPLTQRRRGW